METLLIALVLSVTPQERPASPPPPAAKENVRNGLTVTFENASGRDVRNARLASIYVPSGTPPTPFLDAGPFKATWEGFARVDLGTDVIFTAVGNGRLVIKINDKPAFEGEGDLSKVKGEEVFFKKGANRFVAQYESPKEGDAWVRVFWESPDWQREPLHPREITHDAGAAKLLERQRLRDGRQLMAMRRCIKCHEHPAKGMPELAMDAPDLSDAGARLHPAWIAEWVLNPRKIRPEATMPVLGLSPQDAADIAAFLATKGKPTPAPKGGDAKAGGHLFAEIRCIGCHTLPDKNPAPERIPLYAVAAKWRPGALRAFLKAPERHYAWIEMPNFQLTDDETEKLASFLLGSSKKELLWSDVGNRKGDAARGKDLVTSKGCLACHKVEGLTNAPKAPKLAAIPADGWARGCMAEKPSGAPDFGLSKGDRDALVAFASTDLSALDREDAPEFVSRTLKALRCVACHKRDKDYDLWADLQGEAEHLLVVAKKDDDDDEFFEPEPAQPVVPSLTWTGGKLKPQWVERFLSGKVKERPRPYLKNVRMPVFASRAASLARGLALEHGCPPVAPPEPDPDPKMGAIGRKLAGSVGGFDCLSCHGIGPKKATKVFEGPGPNFKYARERLRHDYFLRWVREPLRVEPGTKMPQFFQGGRSQLFEVLDGDAGKQMEALWQYLLQGELIEPPEG